MTSDTKIGLLLGLIFIFVIAFVINGLPGFDRVQGPNALAKDLAGYQQEAAPDLGAREREAVRYLESPYSFPNSDPSVRDQMTLPPVDPEVEDTATVALNDIQLPQMLLNPNLRQRTLSQRVAAWPKLCEVREGDNLAKIAKRYYGSENGNKAVNIKKIFEANKDILPSQDALKVGQQLIVPALTPAASKALEQITTPVESVAPPAVPEPWSAPKAEGVKYTVKKDDSLWKIATTELGNGARYREIIKLNEGMLPDENALKPGMILTLPVH